MKKLVCAWMMLMVTVGVALGAGVPPLINYQGEVKADDGTPLATGFHDIDFLLYDKAAASEGGTLLWSKRYNLYVMNGMFNAILGQGGSDVPGGQTPAFTDLMDVFKSYNGDQGAERYLALAVDGGAELTPRQRLLSAPYAVRADSAYYADKTLNASNAATADRAKEADHAANADEAVNADKLGNVVAADYALKSQFAAAPASQKQAQFWDGSTFHNGPLYWNSTVLGVGDNPGNDPSTGLRIVKGSLRPAFGYGWDKGIVFQNGPDDGEAHWLHQTQSSNGKELYLESKGSGNSYITVKANSGLTLQGQSSVGVVADNGNFDVHAQKMKIFAPVVENAAYQSQCRTEWVSVGGDTKGSTGSFTAKGDGLFILNAQFMEWELTVPNHPEGDFSSDTRKVRVRFDGATRYHSFIWPVRKGMVISGTTIDVWDQWGDSHRWWSTVIYFN